MHRHTLKECYVILKFYYWDYINYNKNANKIEYIGEF